MQIPIIKRKIYLINLESYIAAITPSLDWHHFILPNSSKSPRQHINLTSNRGFVSDESPPARVIGEPFLRFATTLDTGEFLFPIFSFYLLRYTSGYLKYTSGL